MPANVYECMFLLDTNKVAGDVPNAAKQLHTLLEKNHAEILASRPWDERRLAYSIGNHKKGLYYLTYFRTEGKNLVTLEHDFHLTEMILRSLILKIDRKMVDEMLRLARDEHALQVAYQAMAPEAGEEGEGGPRAEGGEEGEFRGPRRGPRRHAEEVEKE